MDDRAYATFGAEDEVEDSSRHRRPHRRRPLTRPHRTNQQTSLGVPSRKVSTRARLSVVEITPTRDVTTHLARRVGCRRWPRPPGNSGPGTADPKRLLAWDVAHPGLVRPSGSRRCRIASPGSPHPRRIRIQPTTEPRTRLAIRTAARLRAWGSGIRSALRLALPAAAGRSWWRGCPCRGTGGGDCDRRWARCADPFIRRLGSVATGRRRLEQGERKRARDGISFRFPHTEQRRRDLRQQGDCQPLAIACSAASRY